VGEQNYVSVFGCKSAQTFKSDSDVTGNHGKENDTIISSHSSPASSPEGKAHYERKNTPVALINAKITPKQKRDDRRR
jgi:hypothetical protein